MHSPRDPCVDQPVVQPLLSLFVVVKYIRSQTESFEDAGSERGDEDVSLCDEAFGDRESGWVLGVEGDRAFAFAEHVVCRRCGWPVNANDGSAVMCENETGKRGWGQAGKLVG